MNNGSKKFVQSVWKGRVLKKDSGSRGDGKFFYELCKSFFVAG